MAPTFAVIGAGGSTGQLCLERLLNTTDASVRAIVRDPAKYQDKLPKDPRLSVVSGDVSDASSLSSALNGCQGIIFAASGSGYWTADSVDHKGVANTATAAHTAGVGHMVLVSSQKVSAHNRWNPIRIMLNNFKWGLMDAKLAGETALRASGVPYTIVRPGGLSNAAGGKTKLVAAQGDKGVPGASASISRADVAAACVAALLHPQASKRVTLELGASKEAVNSPAEFDAALQHLFDGLKQDTA